MNRSITGFAAIGLLSCLIALPRANAQGQKPAAPAANAPETEFRLPTPPPQYHPPAEVEGAPLAPTRHLSFAPNYSAARRWIPNVIGPYEGRRVVQPDLKDTPRVDQIIQGGKLMLSLEDAISLALENNLNIEVERYTPWIDEAALLYAKSGASGLTPFDPTVTSNLSLGHSDIPYNEPFLAGAQAAANTPTDLESSAASENFGYTQGFATGTQAQVTFDNSRGSTNFGGFYIFNPYFQSTLTIELTQPLLRGFGRLPNTRFIIEAKNNVKVGESQFKQEAVAIITQVETDYWNLVYAREYVKIEQVTVAADQQLYQNNQSEVRVGTMPPTDVITAQSQLATDQQYLVLAQNSEMQQNAVLLAAITKDMRQLVQQGVEIDPTSAIYDPAPETLSLKDAIDEALRNRPEMTQAALTLKNAGVEVKATMNLLLPSLNVFAEYQGAGLSGAAHPTVATGTFVGTSPVFSTSGAIPSGATPTGYVGSELTVPGAPIPEGVVSGWNQMIHADYPTFEAGLNLTLPIRNRAAQGQYAEAQLTERQQRVNYQDAQQNVTLNVRQSMIAIEEGRAAVAAAKQARIYNQQSYNDSLKELQLGSATAFTVVQKQVLLTQAEAAELQDRIQLILAEINLDQALGRTLEVHNISIADAMSGKRPAKTARSPEIPGTPDAIVEN
ncbi:MAG: TolC family protein [Candidatus Acidiferrales bacterium]